jgi:hypothetical protein
MIASATVTISDHTKPARSLYDLLSNGSANGYTVVGGFSGDVSVFGAVAYRSIQVDSGSAGSVYVGDANIANDGSRQGLIISAGDVWDRDNATDCESLQNLFVRASADNTVFNTLVETA